MNKIYSGFTITSISMAMVLSLMAPFVIYMSANSPAAGLFIPLLYSLLVIFFWLTEFRTRAHRVVIEEKRISKNEYFGFGREKAYRFSDFNGFITTQQPGRFGPKEFIFLISEDKREICISEFYHSNYTILKNSIKTKLPHLGEKEYKWGYEYRQMLR